MYYSGMILEITKEYCIVMSEEGYFYKLKKKAGVKEGDRIYFIDDDILEDNKGYSITSKSDTSKKRLRAVKLAAAAAAVIVCVLTVIVPEFMAEKVYATVSFDMGYGIQVDLDDDGKVINAESYDHLIYKAEQESIRGLTIDELWDYLNKEDENKGKTAMIGYSPLESGKDIEAELENELQGLEGSGTVYLKGD